MLASFITQYSTHSLEAIGDDAILNGRLKLRKSIAFDQFKRNFSLLDDSKASLHDEDMLI
jgi:hypothetical protein